MGHYAKLGTDELGNPRLFKAEDKGKDQTYFLCQISKEQVASCLFPLGDLPKTEVRRLAHELGLSSVMDKKDSTGVCFIGERHFKEFLQNYMPAKPGKVILLPQGRARRPGEMPPGTPVGGFPAALTRRSAPSHSPAYHQRQGH